MIQSGLVNGYKRRHDDVDRKSHKQDQKRPKIDHSSYARLTTEPLSRLSSERMAKSAVEIENDNTHDANHKQSAFKPLALSKVKIEQTPRPSAARNVTGPFVIEDDSDDEIVVSQPQLSRRQQNNADIDKLSNRAREKAAQKQESERLRREAALRKYGISSSSRAEDLPPRATPHQPLVIDDDNDNTVEVVAVHNGRAEVASDIGRSSEQSWKTASEGHQAAKPTGLTSLESRLLALPNGPAPPQKTASEGHPATNRPKATDLESRPLTAPKGPTPPQKLASAVASTMADRTSTAEAVKPETEAQCQKRIRDDHAKRRMERLQADLRAQEQSSVQKVREREEALRLQERARKAAEEKKVADQKEAMKKPQQQSEDEARIKKEAAAKRHDEFKAAQAKKVGEKARRVELQREALLERKRAEAHQAQQAQAKRQAESVGPVEVSRLAVQHDAVSRPISQAASLDTTEPERRKQQQRTEAETAWNARTNEIVQEDQEHLAEEDLKTAVETGSTAVVYPAVSTPALGSGAIMASEAERQKQQRIEAKKARNARNARNHDTVLEDDERPVEEDLKFATEMAEEPEVQYDTQDPTKGAKFGSSLVARRADGPFSLNSLAGQAAVSRLHAQPFTQARQPPVARTASGRAEKVREIHREDIQLMQWRDSGAIWGRCIELYKEVTGEQVSQTTLIRRYRQIKDAMDAVKPPESLLDQIVDGDVEAREQLNVEVHGRGPFTPHGTSIERPPSTGGQLPPPASKRPLMRLNGPSGSRSSFPLFSSGTESSSNTLASAPTSPPLEHESTQERRTTGGKTVNEQTLFYYLQAQAEAYAEELESDEEEVSDQENFTEEDYCHYYYVVQRREISRVDLEAESDSEYEDDGSERRAKLEEKPFMDCCGRGLATRRRANAAAVAESLIACDKDLARAIANGYIMFERELVNGLHWSTVDCGDEGMVQVRVDRRLRRACEWVKPSTTAEWLPRVVYHVKHRTVTSFRTVEKPTNELFDELTESVEEVAQEMVVDEKVYSDLDLANNAAIDHVMKLTFKSMSLNLTRRAEEKKQERDGLVEHLEGQGEGARFHKSLGQEVDGKGRPVNGEVFVRDAGLEGPRN